MKTRRYPIWSTKTIFIVSLLTLAITSGLIFYLGHSSVFVEMQVTLLAIALILFLFLTIGLYQGVRLSIEKISFSEWSPIESDSLSSTSVDFPDMGGDGLIGVILSVIAWIVISVIVLFLFVMIANFIWGVIFIIGLITYWVFYRALRQVFVKSKICKGNIMLSFMYSLLYTTLYTGWIFGVLWISKYIGSAGN